MMEIQSGEAGTGGRSAVMQRDERARRVMAWVIKREYFKIPGKYPSGWNTPSRLMLQNAILGMGFMEKILLMYNLPFFSGYFCWERLPENPTGNTNRCRDS